MPTFFWLLMSLYWLLICDQVGCGGECAGGVVVVKMERENGKEEE